MRVIPPPRTCRRPPRTRTLGSMAICVVISSCLPGTERCQETVHLVQGRHRADRVVLIQFVVLLVLVEQEVSVKKFGCLAADPELLVSPWINACQFRDAEKPLDDRGLVFALARRVSEDRKYRWTSCAARLLLCLCEHRLSIGGTEADHDGFAWHIHTG